MTAEWHDLERELKSLKPRRPSPAVKAGLEEALGVPTSGRDTVIAFPARREAALNLLQWAAAIAILLGTAALLRPYLPNPIQSPMPGPLLAEEAPLPAPAPSLVIPVSVDSVLVDERDAGLIFGPDAQPMRRLEYAVIDRIEYEDEKQGQRIRVQRPRTEVVLVAMNPD